ncbi:AraC family transcriptional regulator [Thalassovita aquimarina]|uniref:AraC family transcriptional regulator n=1 Tax=Thalassovita aquimarina TaxID=2785917 RepID=A0ABS5HVJ6_9RHOB|nr:AraC family transcriptional regulator [Thalassovita aquimarina]
MISALYARKQIKQAVKVEDTARLYSIVGLDPDQPEDPADMVSVDDYHTLLEAIADSEWPNLRFHMRVCAGMRCEDFGAFGLAFKAAPTLRHAFQRLGRYTRLHNQVSKFSYIDREGVFCWTHEKPCSDRLGAQLANEAALATTLTLSRENTMQGLTPLRVQFTHDRGGSTDPLVEHFGIEPIFGAEIDGMQFAIEDIDRATSVGDPAIWKFFTDHLETTLPETKEAARPLEEQVMEEIAKLLSGGVPQLSEVAAALAMGPRTLQRRLSEQGKTYQVLVNDARRQLAQQLVSGSRYSLSEIAFLTGFSEQSAFTRAFKRWSGQTPGAYRSSSPD